MKQRRWLKIIVVIGLGLSVPTVSLSQETGNNESDSVAVLGLDQEGQAVTKWVPKKAFNEHLLASLNAVQDSLKPSLIKLDDNPYLMNEKKFKAWELRTLVIGVGLSAQFGLGPLFSITLSPKLKLIFTNSRNPVYPD